MVGARCLVVIAFVALFGCRSAGASFRKRREPHYHVRRRLRGVIYDRNGSLMVRCRRTTMVTPAYLPDSEAEIEMIYAVWRVDRARSVRKARRLHCHRLRRSPVGGKARLIALRSLADRL
jgi:hypothetical protein